MRRIQVENSLKERGNKLGEKITFDHEFALLCIYIFSTVKYVLFRYVST